MVDWLLSLASLFVLPVSQHRRLCVCLFGWLFAWFGSLVVGMFVRLRACLCG